MCQNKIYTLAHSASSTWMGARVSLQLSGHRTRGRVEACTLSHDSSRSVGGARAPGTAVPRRPSAPGRPLLPVLPPGVSVR